MTASSALLDSATFADALLEAYGWPEEAVETFITSRATEELSYEAWVLQATAHAATSPVQLQTPFL